MQSRFFFHQFAKLCCWRSLVMFVVWSIIQWQNLFFGKCFAAWPGWRRIQKSQICVGLLLEVVNCSRRRTKVCLVKDLSHKDWWHWMMIPSPLFCNFIFHLKYIFLICYEVKVSLQCCNHIARSLGRILNIQYNQSSFMTYKSGNQVCSHPYSWFLLFSQQDISRIESRRKNLLFVILVNDFNEGFPFYTKRNC